MYVYACICKIMPVAACNFSLSLSLCVYECSYGIVLFVFTYVCMFGYMYACGRQFLSLSLSLYKYSCICICTCVCIFMFVFTYICMFCYIPVYTLEDYIFLTNIYILKHVYMHIDVHT
jgi:hypothetical protein